MSKGKFKKESALKKKRSNRSMAVILPIMGLTIMISLAVMMYFLAPIVNSLLEDQFGDQWIESTKAMDEQQVNLMLAGAMWIVGVAVISFLGAAFYGGESSVDKEGALLPPREGASSREIRKYEKGLKKIRKAKRRDYNRLKKKKDKLEKQWRRQGKYEDDNE